MKLGLQLTLAFFSLIPLYFAFIGVSQGTMQFTQTAPSALDNQYRYLSAYYLSLTFFLWWIIPHIERHATPVRIIACVVFLGGLARFYSILDTGVGEPIQIGGMLVELAAIMLIPWHMKLKKTPKASKPADIPSQTQTHTPASKD